ncbi:MAG TPA: type II toxin-antitoxin system RelE/ParE family toxin [Candidatus Binatia bacterium]
MAYQIFVEKSAARNLRNIPYSNKLRIDKAIQSLAVSPRPLGCTKLTGRDGYRIRVGNYRVLYTIHDQSKTVVIYLIDHRKDVYR